MEIVAIKRAEVSSLQFPLKVVAEKEKTVSSKKTSVESPFVRGGFGRVSTSSQSRRRRRTSEESNLAEELAPGDDAGMGSVSNPSEVIEPLTLSNGRCFKQRGVFTSGQSCAFGLQLARCLALTNSSISSLQRPLRSLAALLLSFMLPRCFTDVVHLVRGGKNEFRNLGWPFQGQIRPYPLHFLENPCNFHLITYTTSCRFLTKSEFCPLRSSHKEPQSGLRSKWT